MMPFINRFSPSRRLRAPAIMLLAVAAIALAPPPTPAAPATPDAPGIEPFTDTQKQAIEAVDAYLNGITDLEGDFTQIAPDGQVSEGRFYIRRPGRARFDYAPPNELLVIADGFWIGVIDGKLKTADRYPIDSTPYWALLKEEVDLRTDASILAVERDSGLILIAIADPSGDAQGELTLIFEEVGEPAEIVAEADLKLAQWLVTDAQGLTTSVTVFNLVEGQRALNKLFTLHQYD